MKKTFAFPVSPRLRKKVFNWVHVMRANPPRQQRLYLRQRMRLYTSNIRIKSSDQESLYPERHLNYPSFWVLVQHSHIRSNCHIDLISASFIMSDPWDSSKLLPVLMLSWALIKIVLVLFLILIPRGQTDINLVLYDCGRTLDRGSQTEVLHCLHIGLRSGATFVHAVVR